MLLWEKKIIVWENNSTQPGMVTETYVTHANMLLIKHKIKHFTSRLNFTYNLQDLTVATWTNIPIHNNLKRRFTDKYVLPPSLCVRWGECARSVGASQLRCRVCSCPQGFLPQHDLSQGSAAAPAQTQAQCTYARLSCSISISEHYYSKASWSQLINGGATENNTQSGAPFSCFSQITVTGDFGCLNQRFCFGLGMSGMWRNSQRISLMSWHFRDKFTKCSFTRVY